MFHQVRRVVVGLAQRRGYRSCTSCGAVLPTALPVCAKCRHIGRVEDSITHHELLGLPYGPNPFVIDADRLRREFLAAQRLCHPDAWATGSEGDRRAAQAASNAVNTAYKTLLSPVERVEYVLLRNGKGVGEGEQVEDMELMEEVMETREAIEGSTEEELARLKEGNEGNIQATMEEIEGAVGRSDWAQTKTWAVRLKYLFAIHQAILNRAENAERYQ